METLSSFPAPARLNMPAEQGPMAVQVVVCLECDSNSGAIDTKEMA